MAGRFIIMNPKIHELNYPGSLQRARSHSTVGQGTGMRDRIARSCSMRG